MKRLKKWKQPIISFLLGYMIFLLISFILQIQFYQELKTVELDINLKEIILHTIKSGIFIYISVYFLIFTLNPLYNLSLAKKLNKETEKMRDLSEEKILKERGRIDMKKRVLKIILVILVIIYVIFSINLIRKMVILDKYSKAVEERIEQNNNYGKVQYGGGGNLSETYRKGDVSILKSTSPDGAIHTIYGNNEYYLVISESNKTATKYNDEFNLGGFVGAGDGTTDSFRERKLLEKLRLAYETKITTEYVNNKECYRMYINDYLQSYVTKDDFVAIKWSNSYSFKYQNGVKVMDPVEFDEVLDYSFGNITDEDVKIPDLEGYTIEER